MIFERSKDYKIENKTYQQIRGNISKTKKVFTGGLAAIALLSAATYCNTNKKLIDQPVYQLEINRPCISEQQERLWEVKLCYQQDKSNSSRN